MRNSLGQQRWVRCSYGVVLSVWAHTHTHTLTHMHTHAHTHTHTLTHMHIHTYTHTQTHTFSPAYLRDIGPQSFLCSFYFDVGLGWSQWLWCGHWLHLKYASPICLQFRLCRTLTCHANFASRCVNVALIPFRLTVNCVYDTRLLCLYWWLVAWSNLTTNITE